MYEYESAPLARILELGKTADFDKVTSNCPYFMLFKNNPLPKVPASTISLIQEMHQSKEKMSEILYNISFPFPVITQSISEISLNINQMSENNKIYSSIFLFYSFFAWFINYTKTGLVYPGDIVLSSLLHAKVDGSPNYEILAKSAFYFGYKALVESKTTPLFEKYIPTAQKFFLNHNDSAKETYPNLIPIVSGNLFVDILSHFEDPDKNSGEQISFSNDLFEIVDMIYESANLHPYIFNEKIICYIFDFFKSYMCSKTEIKTIKSIIKCFSSLLKFSNSEFNYLISNDLSQIILTLIHQNLQELNQKKINNNENFDFTDHLITLPNDLEIIQDFTYPKVSTFSEGFDRKPLINMIIENDPEKVYYCLYDDFHPLIQSMFNLEKNIKSLISSFISLFESCNDQIKENNIAFFLLFIVSIINQKKKSSNKGVIKYSELIRPILNSLNSKIEHFFDPKITIFNQKSEFFLSEEINSIRNEFLCDVVHRKKKLHCFLTTLRLYPLLFTEIIYRLTSLNIRIPLEFLDEIMNFYRFMNISNIETKIVEIVREALFNYISEVYSESLFDGLSIQISYFLCLMESSIADEMTNIMVNYFKHVGTVIDSKSFVLFLKFFQINSINDQESVIKVMIRIIKLLLLIFQIKIFFSRAFKSVYLEILSILSQIKMTEELLKLTLSLFILISPEHELSDIEAYYLKKSILNMYPSFQFGNNDFLFADILKLISTDNSHLYNCRVLPLAYSLFSTIKFNELIEDFLYLNLLKNSPNAIENCKKCHLVEFDCFLLEKLSEMKKQKYSIENEEKIKKILLIFEMISKYFSSPTAVLKFTSLLTPKNDNQKSKVLSRYMPLYMNTLSQLVEVDYWKKTKHMKLDETDEYCGNFIVPKSFSICFWISCRSFDSEGNLNIFTADSFEKKKQAGNSNNSIKDVIKIYMNNNELNFEINQFHCSCGIKKDEWTFVTVSFTKKAVNIYVNLIIISIILTSKFTNSHFCNSDTKDYVAFHGKIGDASTVSLKEAIELGFFGVLNFQNVEDMKRLYHSGVFSYPINPIFSYNISNHPMLSDTTTLTDSSLISSKAISVTSIVFNFVFCLTNLWKCDILIPLYSILNVPFEQIENDESEETYYNELPYITTHIITKCLIFNPKLQSHFYQTSRIRIISYLLYRMPTLMFPNPVFDIRLYQFFYKMYLCVSDEKLHSQIYFSIIANLKLINQSSPADHLKILENWLSDVHQVPHFVQIGSFSVLLSLMNIYYKYKAIDHRKIDLYSKRLKDQNKIDELNEFNSYIDVIQNEVDINNSQVSLRRKIFHQLLLFSANQSFDLSDYYEIVNQCIELYQKAIEQQSIDLEKQTDDEIRKSSFVKHDYIKEILDMIRFLNLFIRQSPMAFKNIKIAVDDVLMLNELIVYEKYNNEKITVNLIDTIVQFYKQEVFDEVSNQKLSVHFDLIINILYQVKMTNNFFHNLIRHAHKSSPELFLFCCWYLATQAPTNEELQNIFISSLLTSFNSLSKQTLSDSLFLFWAVFFSNHLLSNRNQKMFFAYIISILDDNWHFMLSAISLFSDSPDSTILNYLYLTSLIHFNKYNNINYTSDRPRNITLGSVKMNRSVSYISPRRKSLETFFSPSTSSMNLLMVENYNVTDRSNKADSVEIEISPPNTETDNEDGNSKQNNENDIENNDVENEVNEDDDIKCFQNKNLSEKDLIVFLNFSVLFILTRPHMIKITTLEKLFVQSPFMDENHEIVQSENDSSLQTFMNKTEKVTVKKEPRNSLTYGLRFDNEMNWLDLEFAKTIFNMRMNYRLKSLPIRGASNVNQNEIKLFSILLYFISHADPEFVDSQMEKINSKRNLKLSPNSAAIDPNSSPLIRLIFIVFDFKKITSDFFADLFDGAMSFLNEIRSSFLQIQLSMNVNFSSITSKVEDMALLQKKVLNDTFHQKELNPISETGIKKLMRFMSLLEEYDKLQWELLMKKMMIEKGPWYDDLISSSYHFKRSSILCSNLCPFLMKRKRLIKKQKKKNCNSIDYYNNSDFYFWSHNQFLPSFEQAAFLDANLTLKEKQNSEKAIVYDCILQKIDKFFTVKLKIEPNAMSIVEEKVVEDGINLVPKVIFIDKNDVLIMMSKIINGESEKIEIFSISCSKSYLLICENANAIIDSFVSICNPQKNHSLIIKSDVNDNASFLFNFQKKWADKKCSNFEYIMLLNIIACRSFNDIGQYPIFPVILSDYSSDKIELGDSKIFKDFSKINEDHHFTSPGILAPSTVSSYLQRISPFNKISKKCEFQKSNTKSEIDQNGQILTEISEKSMEQLLEITPEFFFMPEFLTDDKTNNSNDCFGDVTLPKWSKTPLDFIYRHRKALESDFVSEHLNEWIDLVFGTRQKEISSQIQREATENSNPGEEFVAVANDAPSSLSLMMKKEELPLQIFASPHMKQTLSIIESDDLSGDQEAQTHHYLIKNQEEWESVLYVYFENDNLFVFDSSSNVSKFLFRFDSFELNFVEKKPIVSSQNSKEVTSDISFYPEFEFQLKYSSLVSQQSKKSIIAHNSIELNSFYLIDIDSNFNIALKKFCLNFSNSKSQKEERIKLNEKNCVSLNEPDKEVALIKIECSDGHFIVVSNSDELHLTILEIIDNNENSKENENDNFVIKRYEQFIAAPKCCAISSIFKTFVVAADDGSMQIASVKGHSPNSKQWNLIKIVNFDQNADKEDIFVPEKILITDSFGFIVIYGKMKLSLDKNESFIYVFTINGIFVRKQKIDGEIVNWSKWKSKKGFDFLTLVIKKKSDAAEELINNDDVNLQEITDDESDETDNSVLDAKSYSFSYKIAICEVYYLQLDILKNRFTQKIVSVDFLVDKNLLAVFQSDGNFILINYEPNDLFID